MYFIENQSLDQMFRILLFCLSCIVSGILFAQVPSVSISPLNPSVCSGDIITLTASTNAAPGATFLWMPGGATTPSITVSPSTNTTYTCTVSSGAFSNSSNSTVTVNALPTATMVVNGISLTVISTNPVMCLWPNGSIGPSIIAFQSGQICCEIMDFSGCSNTICVNYINPTTVYSIAGQDATIDCNQNTNGYQMNNAAVAGHTYSWSPATGLSNPNIANPIANPAITTTYTLTDFDANGDSITDQVTIMLNTNPPTLNAGPDQTVCQGGNVTLNATSNASPINWNNSVQNNIPFVANTPGSTTYTASVTGTNGCVATDSMVVLVNPQPQFSITASGPTALCSGQSVTLCVPYHYPWAYSWSNASLTNCITVSYPGTYCVIVTDYLTGCSHMACIPVDIFNSTNAGPDATISCSQNTSGAQIGAAAVSGNTYSWSPTTGLNNPNISNPIANPSATTTYTLTATNSSGCTATDQVVVIVNTTPPTLNAGPDQTVCQGASVALTAVSNVPNMNWSNGVQNNVPFVVNNVGTTTYPATATGATGCVATDQVIVTVNPTPVATVTASGPLTLCPGQSVTLCAATSQIVGYMWCTGETTQCITVNSPGNYCLVLQGLSGCMSSTTNTIVTFGNSAIANAGPDAPISCSQNTSGAQIGAAAVSGNTYSWSPTTGLNNPNIANPSANPSATTTYTLTVTNSGGCTATDQVVVSVNTTPPTVSISANGATTLCPGSTIQLSALASPGCTFQWKKNGLAQSSGNTASFVAFQPGTYTVTVTNPNGCSSTSNSIVISLLQASIQALGPTTICQGSTLVLQATTGIGYTYQWVKNGNPSLTFGSNATYNAISSGTYSVNILTPSGCLLSSNLIQVQIIANPTVSIIATGSTTICNGNSLTLVANSNSTGLSFQWKKNGTLIAGATNSFFSVTQAGTYTVVVTNAACPNNQVSSNAITVSVNPSPTPTINANTLLIAPGASATLTTPFVNSYTYQWQQVTSTFPISMAGANSNTYTTSFGATYRVKVTNTFGCIGYSPQLTLVNTQQPQTESPKSLSTETNQEIHLYPNPNNGHFTIEIPSDLSGQDLHILDINGRTIRLLKLHELSNSIDMEELNRGTYWLQIGRQKPIQIVKN